MSVSCQISCMCSLFSTTLISKVSTERVVCVCVRGTHSNATLSARNHFQPIYLCILKEIYINISMIEF